MSAANTPSRCRVLMIAVALIFMAALPGAKAQNNLTYQGGAVMHGEATAYLIYWLPPGVVLDSTVPDGVGNFKTITQNFFSYVSGTSYYNILSQYPDNCGGPKCTVNGTVAVGGAWTDTRAYPHAGTAANPLTDGDIQAEVNQAIATNHWQLSDSNEYFVFTGAGIQECQKSGSCTGNNGFCAYHSSYSNGQKAIIYAYMSDVNFNVAGCNESISSGANGQLASDQEVAAMSHEFFESVSDPYQKGWWNPNNGNEIGDNCNQQGTPVYLNSGAFDVQKQWSNKTSNCVTTYLLPAFTNIAPTSGPATGGTAVTLSGGGFTGTTSVTFGNTDTFPPTPAERFTVNSDSTIIAYDPPCSSLGCGQGVTGDIITVTNNYGSVGSPQNLNFQHYTTITGVNPPGGPASGGTTITVTGNGFDNGGPYPAFAIGGITALDVHCESNIQCTMITPASPPGIYDVTSGGTAPNPHDKFTYGAPILSSIDPPTGSEDGGTMVTFNGSNLSNNMQAVFGTYYVGVIACASSSQCTAYAPRGTGTVPVTIGGSLQSTVTQNDYFKYVLVPSGYMEPHNGSLSGGTGVEVALSSIVAATATTSFVFDFGQYIVPATNVSCSPSTLNAGDSVCTMTTPPQPQNPPSDGPLVVPVTARVNGNSFSIGSFTYEAPIPPPPTCRQCILNGGRCVKSGSTWICKCATVSHGGECE
jgi:hypothetical protein